MICQNNVSMLSLANNPIWPLSGVLEGQYIGPTLRVGKIVLKALAVKLQRKYNALLTFAFISEGEYVFPKIMASFLGQIHKGIFNI